MDRSNRSPGPIESLAAIGCIGRTDRFNRSVGPTGWLHWTGLIGRVDRFNRLRREPRPVAQAIPIIDEHREDLAAGPSSARVVCLRQKGRGRKVPCNMADGVSMKPDTLRIAHFKSIRQIETETRRVNVFIGKPNTGKSNILESLGLLSLPYANLNQLVRFETMTHLFHDFDISRPLKVGWAPYDISIAFRDARFMVVCDETRGGSTTRRFSLECGYDGTGTFGGSPLGVKFYKFQVLTKFPAPESDSLLPPHGQNLVAVLVQNKNLKQEIKELLNEFGHRLVLYPHENIMGIQKGVDDADDVVIRMPYQLVSDTLQRMIFHLAAIETNNNSTLVFEEPESHAFPYYTKHLAERIALDARNRYFLATHNPYFLMPLVEKTAADDLAVFVTYYENYETKVKLLTDKEITRVLDLDESVFFNLDKFLVGR